MTNKKGDKTSTMTNKKGDKTDTLTNKKGDKCCVCLLSCFSAC